MLRQSNVFLWIHKEPTKQCYVYHKGIHFSVKGIMPCYTEPKQNGFQLGMLIICKRHKSVCNPHFYGLEFHSTTGCMLCFDRATEEF
jgi:hypothetical protein